MENGRVIYNLECPNSRYLGTDYSKDYTEEQYQLSGQESLIVMADRK